MLVPAGRPSGGRPRRRPGGVLRTAALVGIVALGCGTVLQISRDRPGARGTGGHASAAPSSSARASAAPSSSSMSGGGPALAAGAAPSATAQGPTGLPTHDAARVSAAPSTRDTSGSAADAVAQAVRKAAAGAHGLLSVAVEDLSSGVTAHYGAAGHSFATASIAKVDILAALLLQAQQAGRELTAAELADANAMITNSDNSAADALYTRIGRASGLDRANRAFGLTSTAAGAAGHWGLTATTAVDQVRLLRAIFGAGSPLDADSRGYLRTQMGLVESDQNWGVSAAADDRSTCRLKNGWLPRSATGLWVVNSIGEVRHDGRQLLIAVLSDGNATQEQGIALVEAAAAAAAGALTGALGTHA